jgi:hypothetical protein
MDEEPGRRDQERCAPADPPTGDATCVHQKWAKPLPEKPRRRRGPIRDPPPDVNQRRRNPSHLPPRDQEVRRSPVDQSVGDSLHQIPDPGWDPREPSLKRNELPNGPGNRTPQACSNPPPRPRHPLGRALDPLAKPHGWRLEHVI